MEQKIPTESDLRNMKVNELLEVHSTPYFRVLRTVKGWLYNFYDNSVDNYGEKWVYVPENNS
jgi:TusA-related sulfurtransferase